MVIPEPNSGCWLWLGAVNSAGYGQLRGDGRAYYAHRMSYEVYRGDIPAGLVVRHKCDNPLCANPDHLELGTMSDNTQDMLRRGRHHTTPTRGDFHYNSKLTSEDVRFIRSDPRGASELGRILGVDTSTITDVRKGRTWRHVQ